MFYLNINYVSPTRNPKIILRRKEMIKDVVWDWYEKREVIKKMKLEYWWKMIAEYRMYLKRYKIESFE